MKHQINTLIITIIVAVATVLGVSTFGLPWLNTNSGAIITKDTKEQVIEQRIEEYSKTSNVESDITQAIETVWPSVVSIIATKDLQYYLDDPISYFLGNRPEVQPKKKVTVKVWGGSGIIVSKDGYVITNKHVVTDSTAAYSIITSDWATYVVQQMRFDPMLDVAILKIVDAATQEVPTDLTPAPFVSIASPIRIGQFVVSIGNALSEYANTATFGIVSAKNRTLKDQPDAAYVGLYQTDSSINPWNSGGPLISSNGEIIGMNTAIAQWEGIWFALPLTSEFVQTTLAWVTTGNTIKRPYLGIESTMLTKAIAKKLNLTKFAGIYVNTIQPESPAARAGLLSWDIITEINNKTIQGDMPLLYTLYTYNAEDKISLLVYRDKDYKKIEVTLWVLWVK